MNGSLDEKLEPIYQEVLHRNAGETEFHQSVHGVLETLGPGSPGLHSEAGAIEPRPCHWVPVCVVGRAGVHWGQGRAGILVGACKGFPVFPQAFCSRARERQKARCDPGSQRSTFYPGNNHKP